MRLIPICAGVCLSLLAGGCGAQRGEAKAASAGIPEQPVGVDCLGQVIPGERIIKVSAPPAAIVSELRVRRGSKVVAGQELAILREYELAVASLVESTSDVAVAESAVAQAKAVEKPAAIAAQEAAVRGRRAVLANAEKDFERKQSLLRDGLIPAEDLEGAAAALETARQSLSQEENLLQGMKQVRGEDVEVAERKLAAARARQEYAKAVLNQNRILAPASGTVLDIHAYPGEAVSGEGLLDLADLSRMFVEAEVYVSDIPRVHQGARAVITGQGFAGKISGSVAEIMRQTSENRLFPADAATAADKRVLAVRIRLDDGGTVRSLSNGQVSVHIDP